MIEEINQVIAYDEAQFIPALMQTVKDMEKKKLEVEIKYSFCNGVSTAILIGRKKAKKNEGSNSL